MGILKEFKQFAMRGNVVDLAVGVIIGAAFGKIISSLVGDIIMPPVGLLLAGADFREIAILLKAEGVNHLGVATPAVKLNIGNFLQAVFDFLVIAFCIFLFVNAINKLNRKKEAEPVPPPAPSKEELLLTEIRDLLKEKKL